MSTGGICRAPIGGGCVSNDRQVRGIVRQHGLDRHVVFLEVGHDVRVEQMHGGQRYLVGVEPAPRASRSDRAGKGLRDRLGQHV